MRAGKGVGPLHYPYRMYAYAYNLRTKVVRKKSIGKHTYAIHPMDSVLRTMTYMQLHMYISLWEYIRGLRTGGLMDRVRDCQEANANKSRL